MDPVFITPRELALKLDVSTELVHKWAKAGKIPFIRDDRGRYFFNLNTVANALCFNGQWERRKALLAARDESRRQAALRDDTAAFEKAGLA